MEKAKAYIKSSLGASKPASPSLEKPCAPTDDARVCFVCGGAGFSDSYSVRVKPDAQVCITSASKPSLPTLELLWMQCVCTLCVWRNVLWRSRVQLLLWVQSEGWSIFIQTTVSLPATQRRFCFKPSLLILGKIAFVVKCMYLCVLSVATPTTSGKEKIQFKDTSRTIHEPKR